MKWSHLRKGVLYGILEVSLGEFETLTWLARVFLVGNGNCRRTLADLMIPSVPTDSQMPTAGSPWANGLDRESGGLLGGWVGSTKVGDPLTYTVCAACDPCGPQQINQKDDGEFTDSGQEQLVKGCCPPPHISCGSETSLSKFC